MIKSGTLVLQGHQYVVYDAETRTVLQKAPHLVPGDEVEYADNNVLRIARRRQHATLAIVRGVSEGMSFLFCPLLGPLYNPHLKTVYPIGTRLLVLIPSHPDCQPGLVQELLPFEEAEGDLDALAQTYLSMATTTPITKAIQDVEQGSPLFTKAEQDHRGLNTFAVSPSFAFTPCDGRILLHVIDIHRLLEGTAASLGHHNAEIRAADKACSLFLPNHTIHMLPLEENYCLKAGTAQAVITIELESSTRYSIYRDWIVPQRVLTYEDLSVMLKNPKSSADRMLTTLIRDGSFESAFHYSVDSKGLLIGYGIERPTLARDFVASIQETADRVVSRHLGTKGRFTNPLHRYTDVILHHILAGAVYDPTMLKKLLEHARHQEQCAKGLQDVYKRWTLGRWILGRSFQAVVKGVSNAGVSVRIEELMLDGFVHVSALSVEGRVPRWALGGGRLIGESTELVVGSGLQVTVTKSDAMLGTLELKGAVLENDIHYSINSTNYSWT